MKQKARPHTKMESVLCQPTTPGHGDFPGV